MLRVEAEDKGTVAVEHNGHAGEVFADLVASVRAIIASIDKDGDEKDSRFIRNAIEELFVPCVLAESEEEATNVVMQALLMRLVREVLDGESEHQQD